MSSNDGLQYTPGSGAEIAVHKFTEGGVERYMERTAPGAGVVQLPASPQITVSGETGLYPNNIINCKGKGRFVIRSDFDIAGGSATARLLLYDSASGELGYTDSFSIQSLGFSGETVSRYFGTVKVIDNEFGASGMKVRFSDVSGEIKMYIGVI